MHQRGACRSESSLAGSQLAMMFRVGYWKRVAVASAAAPQRDPAITRPRQSEGQAVLRTVSQQRTGQSLSKATRESTLCRRHDTLHVRRHAHAPVFLERAARRNPDLRVLRRPSGLLAAGARHRVRGRRRQRRLRPGEQRRTPGCRAPERPAAGQLLAQGDQRARRGAGVGHHPPGRARPDRRHGARGRSRSHRRG